MAPSLLRGACQLSSSGNGFVKRVYKQLTNDKLPGTRSVMLALAGAFCLAGCQLVVVEGPKPVTSAAVLAAMEAENTPEPYVPPVPLEGSEIITFMDPTTAQIGGCRALTTITITHDGSFADGMVRLKNTALHMNANMMVPVHIVENINDTNGTHIYQVKMVRCPKVTDA